MCTIIFKMYYLLNVFCKTYFCVFCFFGHFCLKFLRSEKKIFWLLKRNDWCTIFSNSEIYWSCGGKKKLKKKKPAVPFILNLPQTSFFWRKWNSWNFSPTYFVFAWLQKTELNLQGSCTVKASWGNCWELGKVCV